MKIILTFLLLFIQSINSEPVDKEKMKVLAEKIWKEADYYFEKKEYAKAKNLYFVLIGLSNNNPSFYYNLAGIYKNEEKPNLALPYFLKAHELNPEDPETIVGIIDSKFDLKQYKGLETYINLLAKKSKPDNCMVANFYAKLYDETKQNKKALSFYKALDQNCSESMTDDYKLFLKNRLKELGTK